MDLKQKYTMENKVKELISCINYECGVDIMSERRERDIVESRMIFSKIMHTQHHIGCMAISRILNKTHATVLHYLKGFDSLLKYDENFRKRYLNIMNVYLNGIEITDISEAGKIMYDNVLLKTRVMELEKKLDSKLHKLVETVPREKMSVVRERLELIIKMNC